MYTAMSLDILVLPGQLLSCKQCCLFANIVTGSRKGKKRAAAAAVIVVMVTTLLVVMVIVVAAVAAAADVQVE